MDILAGMLAYVAGLGALFGAVAIAFVVFVASPKESPQAQSQPQSASAMLVRPSPPKKPATHEAQAKEVAKESAKEGLKAGPKDDRSHSDRHAAALPGAAQPTASREARHKASTAHARRTIEEERAHRWAYQQDSDFEKRFLGYAD